MKIVYTDIINGNYSAQSQIAGHYIIDVGETATIAINKVASSIIKNLISYYDICEEIRIRQKNAKITKQDSETLTEWGLKLIAWSNSCKRCNAITHTSTN